MIPPFSSTGRLPPGIHWTSWEQIVARFGTNPHRRRLLTGLRRALDDLAAIGCQIVYINGSFVTARAEPGDFDVCWDAEGMDVVQLRLALVAYGGGRAEQKAAYGGELFPARGLVDLYGTTFLEFFQTDKHSRQPKESSRCDWSAAMILNDEQYAHTSEWVARFQQSLDQVRRQLGEIGPTDHGDDETERTRTMRLIYADAFRFQLDELNAQLAEYDALRSGEPVTVIISSIADLPRAVIKARIANGLTQADLAERLELPVEQIEADEEREYESTPLSRLIATAELLGISLGAEIILPTRPALVA